VPASRRFFGAGKYPKVSSRRSTDLLLHLLAVTAGATDVTAFIRLGHVFAGVITGNLVVFGLSVARADGSSRCRSASWRWLA